MKVDPKLSDILGAKRPIVLLDEDSDHDAMMNVAYLDADNFPCEYVKLRLIKFGGITYVVEERSSP